MHIVKVCPRCCTFTTRTNPAVVLLYTARLEAIQLLLRPYILLETGRELGSRVTMYCSFVSKGIPLQHASVLGHERLDNHEN